MTRKKKILAHTLLALFLCTPVIADETTMTFKEYLEQANSYIKAYRHFEAADALKKATELGGAKHPSLHMRLGILYYGLGLIPEAIAEGQRAVHLAPASKWYKYDLAKFYYVDKQYRKAEEQFITLLKLDPGFTLGYYYLAELYFQQKRYNLAWLSLERAHLLGHNGKHLQEKLGPFSSKPEEDFSIYSGPHIFRFIKLSDSLKAQKITDEIWNGKLFENLELELKKDSNTSAEFGIMTLDELKSSVADSLRNKAPYSRPLVIQTGPDYRVMQRILPFDLALWQQSLTQQASVAQQPTVGGERIQRETAPLPESPAMEVSQAMAAAPAGAAAVEEKEKAATKAITKSQISNKLAAFYAIESWKDAWQHQDSAGYFASYSDNFIPEKGVSLERWKQKRDRSITRPTSIDIDIENPVVEMLTDKQLLVTFKQSYTSNSYSDIVVKTLTMDKEESGWKITREREVKKIE